MPTIQNSMRWPCASSGAPWRSSASACACASASSSVASASAVMLAGDGVQRRGLLDVEAGQPLQAQLARHAQRRRQRAAAVLQTLHQGGHGGDIRRARRQQRQFGGVAAPDALHEAAVRRRARQRGGGTHAARARGLCRLPGQPRLPGARAAVRRMDPGAWQLPRRDNSLPPNALTLVSGFACRCRAGAGVAIRAQAAQRGIGPGVAGVERDSHRVAGASPTDSAAHRRRASGPRSGQGHGPITRTKATHEDRRPADGVHARRGTQPRCRGRADRRARPRPARNWWRCPSTSA